MRLGTFKQRQPASKRLTPLINEILNRPKPFEFQKLAWQNSRYDSTKTRGILRSTRWARYSCVVLYCMVYACAHRLCFETLAACVLLQTIARIPNSHCSERGICPVLTTSFLEFCQANFWNSNSFGLFRILFINGVYRLEAGCRCLKGHIIVETST